MDWDITEVSEAIREKVFERDGHNCWLCGNESPIQISHQIDAAATHPFSRFRANGTIPASVTSPNHIDNLFPLCANCHIGYDHTFPDWVLVPDEKTLQKYIDYEKRDYQKRYIASLNSPETPPRSLPLLDRSKIFYHPLLTTEKSPYVHLQWYLKGETRWPLRWLGEPTTVIHRAALRGLFDSTPIQPIQPIRPTCLGNQHLETGIPEAFKKLIMKLIMLWARQPPGRKI